MGLKLRFGDLVQCRDDHYNRGLGIVDRLGMVAELRRKDARILFDVDNQSIWLEKKGVNRVTLPPTESPSLLDRLTWLINFLDASECEFEWDRSGNYRYTVVCPELDLDRIQTVQDYLRPVFIGLKILPRGMNRLGLELILRKD